MSVKEYNIEIPKMDYQVISVGIKVGNENVKLNDNDLMFLTVRENEFSEEYIFQKSLDDGIIYNENTKKYDIEINSEDTKKMEMKKNYGYDITIYYGGDKPRQKAVGNFVIGRKYTLNEVV